MHDWLLISVCYDWAEKQVLLILRDIDDNEVPLRAKNTCELQLTHRNPWGPSASINKIVGPTKEERGQRLEIHMQSGDVITILASSFEMP